jgi:hypothetical protein
MTRLIALLLPLSCALAGMRLLRLLIVRYPARGELRSGEVFCSGLAAGCVVFSQLMLLVTLLGLPFKGPLAWCVLGWGAVEGVLVVRRVLADGLTRVLQVFRSWHALLFVLLLPVIALFALLFWLGGLEGIMEFDAVQGWAFKGKIMFLAGGQAFVGWIRDPNLHHAHFDYPQLVPALYALTYSAIGEVNEFVIKFWQAWMLLALTVGILSLCGTWTCPRIGPIALVTCICYLPMTLRYVRMEGGTLPMLFFCTWGSLLVTQALRTEDTTRLGLGILTLFGAMMTKFEGALYLALWLAIVGVWTWRRRLVADRTVWAALLACALMAVPFVAYRMHKPLQHIESGWLRFGLASPALVLSQWPKILGMSVARRFLSDEFAMWSVHGTHDLEWAGKFDSANWLAVMDEPTVGFAWVVLVIAILVALFGERDQRVALWVVLPTAGVIAFVSLVISCLPRVQRTLASAVSASKDSMTGRYFFPFLVACGVSLVVAAWRRQSKQASNEDVPLVNEVAGGG